MPPPRINRVFRSASRSTSHATDSVASTVTHVADQSVSQVQQQVVAPVQQVIEHAVVAPVQQVATQVAELVPVNVVKAIDTVIVDPANAVANFAETTTKESLDSLNTVNNNAVNSMVSTEQRVERGARNAVRDVNEQIHNVEDISKKYLKDFENSLPKIMGSAKSVGEKIRDVAQIADEAMTILPYVGAGI
jgi:hypothetical protein